MTKVKLLSWNATAKEVKLKSGSEVQILKVTSSLFGRMQTVIKRGHWLGNCDWHHEFAYTNWMRLQPDGSTYPTTDKSTVIHVLENLVKRDGNAARELLCKDESCSRWNGSLARINGCQELQELQRPWCLTRQAHWLKSSRLWSTECNGQVGMWRPILCTSK